MERMEVEALVIISKDNLDEFHKKLGEEAFMVDPPSREEFERNKKHEVYKNRLLKNLSSTREELYQRQFGRIIFTFTDSATGALKAKVKQCTIPERTRTGRRPLLDKLYEFYTIYGPSGTQIVEVPLSSCHLVGPVLQTPGATPGWHTLKGYYPLTGVYLTTLTPSESSNLKKSPPRHCHFCLTLDPSPTGSFKRCKNVFQISSSRTQCTKLWCQTCLTHFPFPSEKLKPCCTLTCTCIVCKWSSITSIESSTKNCKSCTLQLPSSHTLLKRCVICRSFFHNNCAVWDDRLQKDLKGGYGRKQVDWGRLTSPPGGGKVGRIVCYGCTKDEEGGWVWSGLERGGGVFSLGFSRGYGKSCWREVVGEVGGEEYDSGEEGFEEVEVEEVKEEAKEVVKEEVTKPKDSDSDSSSSSSDSDDDIFVKKPLQTGAGVAGPFKRILGVLYLGDTSDKPCSELETLHDWLTVIPMHQRKPGHAVYHAVNGDGVFLENAGPAKVKVDFENVGQKTMWASEVEVHPKSNFCDALYSDEEFEEMEKTRKENKRKEKLKKEKDQDEKKKANLKRKSKEEEEERRKLEKEKRERIRWEIIISKEKERKKREEKKRKRETEEGKDTAMVDDHEVQDGAQDKIYLKEFPASSRVGKTVTVKGKPGTFVIVRTAQEGGVGGWYYCKPSDDVEGRKELKFRLGQFYVDSSAVLSDEGKEKEKEKGGEKEGSEEAAMSIASDDGTSDLDLDTSSSDEEDDGYAPRNVKMICNVDLPEARPKGRKGAGTSARCMPYEPGTMLSKKTELREESCAPTNNFNLDLRQTSNLLTAVKQEKTTSVRAARASQRRMFKDDVIGNMGIERMNVREPKLRFARSGIHGWGVFSQETIPKDALITEYRGELIRTGGIADRREQEYERTKVGSDYMFRIDDNWICDATKKGAMARYINASCDPNCRTQIVEVNKVKKICIYSLRQIEFGEELVYDYKFPIERNKEERIRCYCGAAKCKRWMNWDWRWEDDESEDDGLDWADEI
ncbi:hypothetical protein TrST_g6249 [Triparma strigata]|uniref:[histone H3]-lysine(4) N-trimethyltransferase n=1 Tax=Triparma strigata TaxID=1606541 RepID=A0A9W7BHX8_9STRA|nr:hypothetical protein TrST_g6249 [Triparma strigata]